MTTPCSDPLNESPLCVVAAGISMAHFVATVVFMRIYFSLPPSEDLIHGPPAYDRPFFGGWFLIFSGALMLVGLALSLASPGWSKKPILFLANLLPAWWIPVAHFYLDG